MKFVPAVFMTAFALAACGTSSQRASSPAVYDAATVPKNSVGELVRYGHELILHTRAHMKQYLGANMDCSACHVGAGTKARGGSLVGVYAQFPQWNARSHRVIALQDRLAECFLYSMNGHPPAYSSREMIAMVAYIAYLSRGIAVGASPDPSLRLARITPPQKPSIQRGGALYAQRCSLCHGADGAGNASFPPLWGAKSFNNGAGMHRLKTMAGFVRYNMPKNAPGSLTDQQAYDLSAFVLSHPRPTFQKSRAVIFPAAPAGSF